MLTLSDTHLRAVEGGREYSTTIPALPESLGVLTDGSDMANVNSLIDCGIRTILGCLFLHIHAMLRHKPE